jgi:pSer/pThr/pTyr-binding forkhead associated (FHA) protein
MSRLALRFISGKYKGGEYIISNTKDTFVGRSSNIDLVLMEDMVSRKHARIWLEDGQVNLEDFGSTNGTFVNGEKISRAVVNRGDRILIGTSIMKLVETDKDPRQTSSEIIPGSDSATSGMPAHDRASNTSASVSAMTGTIDEVPLPDLIQLLSSSKKTGTLIITSHKTAGKLHLEKGKIVFCSVDSSPNLAPLKAIFRILSWQTGKFELHGAEATEFPETIDMPTEHILMEGLRQLDEIRNLEGKLPPMDTQLIVVTPLSAKLTDLSPEQLEVFQLVHNSGELQNVIDMAPMDTTKAANILMELLKKSYIIEG